MSTMPVELGRRQGEKEGRAGGQGSQGWGRGELARLSSLERTKASYTSVRRRSPFLSRAASSLQGASCAFRRSSPRALPSQPRLS